MTAEQEALAHIVRLLEEADVPFMVAGSLASSVHGRPRTTYDADIVIDPTADALDRLLAGLRASGFYVDPDVARDALRARRQFNVIPPDGAFKVDLIVCRDRPFSREEFRRRQLGEIAGTRVPLASPEDTILSKLEWARKGGSDRQIEDAAGIVAVQGGALDRAYIDTWADTLGVRHLWRRVSTGGRGNDG